MSKVQKEIDEFHDMRKENLNPIYYKPPYFFPSLEMKLIFKMLYGVKLTRKEQKLFGIWKAELEEYIVWHQEP